MNAITGPDLSPEDMAAIDAIDKNRAIFWTPEASEQTSKHQ